MRFFTALLYYLMALAGCHQATGTTQITHIARNGVEVLFSKTFTEPGNASFHCLASQSGSCHYLLYVVRCESGSTRCQRQELDHFDLDVGQVHNVEGLDDGFRQCAAAETMPRLEGC